MMFYSSSWLLRAVIVSLVFCTSIFAAELEVDTTASGPFSLIDKTGKAVTDADFRGKFMLVFFGYTFCPDVCPTDLQIMAQAMDEMGEAGNKVQPIFISIDPVRDTPEIIAEYAGYFHPRLIGLTGSSRQTATAAWNYGAASMKIIHEDKPEEYTVNHSALTYLLGPDGRFVAAFEHNTDFQTMARGILQHLAKAT